LLFTINGGAGDGSAGAFATNFESAVYFGKSYSMMQAFLTEFLLTMFFLIIILGATDKFANGKFAGIAIGLGLTLIHLISIPITNTSVNPAKACLRLFLLVGRLFHNYGYFG
jgi:aquaporin Z